MTMSEQIRAHYDAQALRPAKLEELKSLATPRWERWAIPGLVAAIVLIAVSLATASSDLTTTVGEEIANNHRRDLAPEYVTDNVETIARRMDRLDFELRAPAGLARRGLRIVGARYCSVQGRIAAQIRLTNAAGREHTLYIVRAFGRVREGTASHNGVTVELWREGDLLIGLAGGEQ